MATLLPDHAPTIRDPENHRPLTVNGSHDGRAQDLISPTTKEGGSEREPSLLPPPDFLVPDSVPSDSGIENTLMLPKRQAPSSSSANSIDGFKTNSTASPVLSEREDGIVPVLSPMIPSGVSLQAIAIPEDQVLKSRDGKLVATASPEETPISPRSSTIPDTSGNESSKGVRSGSIGSKSGRSRASSVNKDDAPKMAQRPPFPPPRHYNVPGNVRRAKSTPRVVLNGNSYVSASVTPLIPPTPSKYTEKSGSSANGTGQHTPTEPKHPKDALTTAPLSIGDYLYLSLATTPASKYDLVSAELRMEKLMNFLSLPIYLEGALWFGSFACLDGWLWNFTILPIRFLTALWLLLLYWMKLIGEIVASFAKSWLRPETAQLEAQQRKSSEGEPQSADSNTAATTPVVGTTSLDPKNDTKKRRLAALAKRRKTSDLQPNHKADLLKGAVVIFSCWILMEFDASRMYHSIRGQNAIKLYVIYSVLEVGDKLLSAIGQDIFECLFSRESLERRPDGTSKVLRPFGFFLLALGYNVLHATALFYQVITLNVAVNSYSNSLITLLLSNQFVEIKTTVFKRIEKENLFQMACADVVERFQLWLMLIIIASRNLVEIGVEGFLGVGGFGLTGLVSAAGLGLPSTTGQPMNTGVPNASVTSSSGGMFLPKSFTIFPKWTGQVMGPFLLVLGSEMLVDWLKHAYICKFNNIKPRIYSRYLDVLAKDYYTHAFAEENLMRRLGLPVLPLACLFIRSSLQTYQMFISTHLPSPLFPDMTRTSFPGDAADAASSPATTAALHKFDTILKSAFSGRAGQDTVDILNTITEYLTIATIFIGIWMVFLVFKFILGMGLLAVARRRYKGMKEREKKGYAVAGIGGSGMSEMNDEKRKIINAGGEKDITGGAAARKTTPLGEVERFDMVAKRIW
ncbi:hypothetical protein TWF718_009914 [Orbilia javanica]|uniref:DUF747-domain-containing protein n=1 Tax=Orbilia javanica TaxID=47235 RepID=A0AAN8MN55_9PEZI